jgi:hypothetical protein
LSEILYLQAEQAIKALMAVVFFLMELRLAKWKTGKRVTLIMDLGNTTPSIM